MHRWPVGALAPRRRYHNLCRKHSFQNKKRIVWVVRQPPSRILGKRVGYAGGWGGPKGSPDGPQGATKTHKGWNSSCKIDEQKWPQPGPLFSHEGHKRLSKPIFNGLTYDRSITRLLLINVAAEFECPWHPLRAPRYPLMALRGGARQGSQVFP